MMNELLWGLQMTLLGMGIVFALLALLWGLLTLVLRLDKVPPAAAPAAIAAQPEAAVLISAAERSEPPGPAMVQGLDAALVAAIMVATLTHRAVRRREAAPAMRNYWPGSLLYASRWVGAGRARQNQNWHRGQR